MNIVYVLAKYPSLTETFIHNEITALLQKNINIKILAIEKEDSISIPEYIPPVIYAGDYLKFRAISAHLYLIRFSPLKYLKTLAQTLFEIGYSRSFRSKLSAFLKGVYFLYTIRELDVDIIHAHFINLPATIAQIMSRISGIPYSCTAHAYDIYKGNIPDIKTKIVNAAFTVTCTKANLLYLNGLLDQSERKQIFHIYHGIDVGKWPVLHSEYPRMKAVHILTVGRLVEKKGITDLLDAVVILTNLGVEARCSIIGDGPLRGELETKAVSLNLENQIRFYGAQPHKVVRAVYETCDVFVLPCRVSEDGDRDGLPNVLLEAMAQGIPVVTTNVSAIPELVKHKVTGVLVKPNQPGLIAEYIIELMNDGKLRSLLSKNGRKVLAEEFSIDVSTCRLEELFINTKVIS